MQIHEAEMQLESRTFRISYALLENAVIAFFYENRIRLGTVAIAMPGTGEVAAGRSSVLVGGKYIMTTRALAERIAGKSGKIALVSLFTELDETEALRTYGRLLEKASLQNQKDETIDRFTHSVRQNV